MATYGFKCPSCGGSTHGGVRDSRLTQAGVRRRRICQRCGFRFTTIEMTVGGREQDAMTAPLAAMELARAVDASLSASLERFFDVLGLSPDTRRAIIHITRAAQPDDGDSGNQIARPSYPAITGRKQ